MIGRPDQVKTVEGLLKRHRAVVLVGARQVGKTTLARVVARRWRSAATYLDLENLGDTRRCRTGPTHQAGPETAWVRGEANHHPARDALDAFRHG